MLKKKVNIALAVLICGLFVPAAASAKTNNTGVSQKKAVSLCKSHGGGTDCSWCHSGHCHEVHCAPGYGCSHTIVSNFRGKPGNIKTTVSGVKSGNPTTPPQRGLRHPVNAGSGLKPVVTSTNNGSHTGPITHRH